VVSEISFHNLFVKGFSDFLLSLIQSGFFNFLLLAVDYFLIPNQPEVVVSIGIVARVVVPVVSAARVVVPVVSAGIVARVVVPVVLRVVSIVGSWVLVGVS